MLVAPVFGVHPLGVVVRAVASEVAVVVPPLVGLPLVGVIGIGADV